MKKILAILLAATAMMVLAFAMTSFAATDSKIVNSVHFTIDTSRISAGMDPSEIGKADVPIAATQTEAGYNVTISDVECINSGTSIKVGDTVRIRFYAELHNTGAVDYYFSGSTKAHVSATENSPTKVSSTSKTRSDSYTLKVTVTLKPLKGQYGEPVEPQWKSGSSLGQAKWSKPEDGNYGGSYDIKLKRDDKSVVSFTNISGTSLNFYPWMTKEGDYTFEIRSAGTGSTRSDWVESDSQWVDEKHVSDGSGQFDPSGTGGSGNTGGKVGWVKDGNTWYYIYPDGTMRKNGWEKVNNKWYYFDASGAMKTGWVTVNGQTYYLDATNGDMKVGWVKTSDGQWYYLNPNPAAGTEGAMYKNQWLNIGGQTYFLKDTGAMATGWLKIDGKFYYFNPNEGGPKGAMVKNTRIDSFYLGADGAWVQGA